MGTLPIVEVHPFPDAGFGLRAGFPSVQVDTLIFEGPPKPLDKDVVQESALAIHGYLRADPLQPVGPGEGRELRALVGVHDLWWAEAVDGLVQRLDTELRLQRVRYPPSQNLAGVPVDDRHEIQEPTPHGQIGDVRRPDLIGAIDAQMSQQIRIDLVPLGWLAGIGFLVDRHQAHQPHETPDALLVHRMTVVPQMPGHLPDTVERRLQELFVDLAHQAEVQRRLALRRVVEGRPRDRQQLALPANGQARMTRLDHAPPHFTPRLTSRPRA